MAALAAQAGRSKPADDENEIRDEGEEQQQLKPQRNGLRFRNYTPNDTFLEQAQLQRPSNNINSNDEEDMTAPAFKRLKNDTKSVLEQALEQAKREAVTTSYSSGRASSEVKDNIQSMAPRKINWDLKRDIQDKLAKLERRTQKVIVELLKERLEKEATAQTTNSDSDEID